MADQLSALKIWVRAYYAELENAPNHLYMLFYQDIALPPNNAQAHIAAQELLQKIRPYKGFRANINTVSAQFSDDGNGDILMLVKGTMAEKDNPTNRRNFGHYFDLRPQEVGFMVANDVFAYEGEWTVAAPVQEEDVGDMDIDATLDLQKYLSNAFLAPLSANRRVQVDEEDEGGRGIHVSNLPTDATKNDLKGAFSVYGPVAAVKIMRRKNSGFVKFEDPNDATSAIEAQTIQMGGFQVRIEAKMSTRRI